MATQVRPTKALASALVGALVLNLLARTSGVTWLALGSGAVLALPVVSLLLRPQLAGLRVEQRPPARAVVGEQVEVSLRVHNTGRRESPPATWRHDHPGLTPVEVALPALAPGAATEAVVTREALARGIHTGGSAVVTTTAPFGLLRWTRTDSAEGTPLIVHPVTTATGHRLDLGQGLAAERSVPVPGAGTEVLDLRPWRPGDARREVSARASARHGKPVVLQRERDAGPSLVVLVAGGGRGPAWERAISSLASRCLAALREGRPPVVLADPPPGRVDALGLLDFFAGVDAAGPLRSRDVELARRRAGRGGTIVVLAPAGGAEPVRAAAAGAGIRVEVHGSADGG